ncbi:copine [Thraustotheca clavata]|uniref:Copine n=1 Tax=Thraustotheca clavata TaxID=74557 RepID=A0A1V9Z9U0_9STRA|nr:copine [Thraustotheca clavata]
MGLLLSTCLTGSDEPAPKPNATKVVNTFCAIPDTFETFDELQNALRKSGLESSNLIVAIDYTTSNQWSGSRTFNGKCLHTIDPTGYELNPYQSVIQILGRTLEVFDDDNLIPAFGFGDYTTQGSSCFPFLPTACEGFESVLACYNRITPTVQLSGPTNFAPVIKEAIQIVKKTGQYHILVIIADGQVNCGWETSNAIVEASHYPISIVVVGVGDGPWGTMEEYDDNLPTRLYDNFQFVDYHRVLQYNKSNPDVGFATAALMEIPDDEIYPRQAKAFKAIPDNFETYSELQNALRKSGLESSNLIVAIDYTKSNEWSGERTFNGKCLHTIDPTGYELNPYQSVIQILGRTLEVFDDDHLIPAFGFGDVKTRGSSCFPFVPTTYEGFANVLACYNRITPTIQLSGPTNFAPVIKEAIRIVNRTGQYHILVIVADGQVTCEKETADSIVEASNYPISIVMVGVGDGPWDTMEEYDDKLPARLFDNFQFVDDNQVLQYNKRSPDIGFATAALMEIPEQYKAIRQLGLLRG